MANRIKCVIINDTDYDLGPTLDGGRLNSAITHGSIVDPSLPNTVKSRGTATFTMTGQPAGWAVYELGDRKIAVQLYWSDPGNGQNGFGVWGNQWSTKGGRACGGVAFEDDQCHPLTFEQTQSADSFTATFKVSLEPAEAHPISSTPSGTCKVAPPASPLDWAEHLSDNRKKMLVSLAHMIPEKIHAIAPTKTSPGEACTEYEQGGFWQSSDSWWTNWVKAPNPNYKEGQPEDKKTILVNRPELRTDTNCTSFQIQVMRRYFKPTGDSSPGGHIWAFTCGGVDCSGVKGDAPIPGWTLALDNQSAKPAPGDTYMVWNDYHVSAAEPAGVAHVGFIAYVPDGTDPDDCWVLADGGQGQRGDQTCNLVWGVVVAPDTVPPKGDIESPTAKATLTFTGAPYICGGKEKMTAPRRVIGWVNLDKVDQAPKEEIDEKAIADIVSRINNVRRYFKTTLAAECRAAGDAGLIFNPKAGNPQSFKAKPW